MEMNQSTIRIALIGAFIVVDSWTLYLILRNLQWLRAMPNPPPELELSQEKFKDVKESNEHESKHLMLSAFIGMNADVAKLVFNYFPYIWNMSVDHANTSIGRAMWFSALDSCSVYAITIPLDFLVVLITGTNNPIIVLISEAADMVFRGLFAAIGTYAFIYVADNFGVRNIVTSLLIFNAVGFVSMALLMKFVLPKAFAPLPDNETGKSVRELASKVGYPMDTIYVNQHSSELNAYYNSALIVRCIFISEPLMSILDAAQVTAAVAHELGHWKYCHTLFHFTASIIQLITMGYVWTIAYGNISISQGFQMDANVHPFIPMYLALFFVFPLFTSLYEGMTNIVKTRFEYAADDYACQVWSAKNLREALVKIASSSKKIYFLDSWYTAWVYGHPSPLLRIRKILHKEEK